MGFYHNPILLTPDALNRDVVGDDLSLYYELAPLEAWELACGSLEIEEA